MNWNQFFIKILPDYHPFVGNQLWPDPRWLGYSITSHRPGPHGWTQEIRGGAWKVQGGEIWWEGVDVLECGLLNQGKGLMSWVIFIMNHIPSINGFPLYMGMHHSGFRMGESSCEGFFLKAAVLALWIHRVFSTDKQPQRVREYETSDSGSILWGWDGYSGYSA